MFSHPSHAFGSESGSDVVFFGLQQSVGPQATKGGVQTQRSPPQWVRPPQQSTPQRLEPSGQLFRQRFGENVLVAQ